MDKVYPVQITTAYDDVTNMVSMTVTSPTGTALTYTKLLGIKLPKAQEDFLMQLFDRTFNPVQYMTIAELNQFKTLCNK